MPASVSSAASVPDLLYRHLAKPLLFRMDAEQAHHLTIRALQGAGRVPGLDTAVAHFAAPTPNALRQQLWGLRFGSPVGLAAGLDKNGEAITLFSALGFGFMEVGTVTPRPQPGNPLPRLFRLPEDGALINRMGFNNAGLDTLARHLSGPHRIPIWANIGKNKDTPNDQAEDDYRQAVRALYPHADGFVVNVSSPNTPGLRSLQQADELSALLDAVLREAERQRLEHLQQRPVLVKLAPDLSDEDFAASVEAAQAAGVSGLIVSNTTLSRAGLRSPNREQAGGLSGQPLRERSTALVRRAYQLTSGKLPIVGVGGIFSAQDAYQKIRAGASLVEVYTALIYEGPALPSRLNRQLTELLHGGGFGHISQAVGVDA